MSAIRNADETITLKVTGMSRESCERNIRKELDRVA